MLSLPWHVHAGLPPREAGDGPGMGQVDEGEGQLSLGTGTGLWGRKESGNTRLPLAGTVPDLYQAVVLESRGN